MNDEEPVSTPNLDKLTREQLQALPQAVISGMEASEQIAALTASIVPPLSETKQIRSLLKAVGDLNKIVPQNVIPHHVPASTFLEDYLPKPITGPVQELPDFEPDRSPQKTAQNTKEMTEATLQLVSLTETLTRLTQTNLQQSRRSEQRALEAEKRSNRIAIISTSGTLAAVAVSIVTLIRTFV